MYFVKPFQDDATKINYLAELIGTHTKNILLQMLRESFSYEQIIPSLHYWILALHCEPYGNTYC